MKLYATVRSERATKGQGGNQFLDIELRCGSAKESELFCSLRLLPLPAHRRYALILTDRAGVSEEVYSLRMKEKEKGEKKKGDVRFHPDGCICRECINSMEWH